MILEDFKESGAEKILEILKNDRKLNQIRKNTKKKIKEFDIGLWGNKYFEVLLNKN